MSEQDAGSGLFGRLRKALGGGPGRPPVVPMPADPVITSRDLDGREPRLRRRAAVPATHLLRAAAVTGRAPANR